MKKLILLFLFFLLIVNNLSLPQRVSAQELVIPFLDYPNIKEYFKPNRTNQITNEIISVEGKEYNIDYSWKNVEIYTPENNLNKKIENIKFEKKFPVLILMHGCTGINANIRLWASFFNSIGFVVILPNSMEIPGRGQWCNEMLKEFDMNKVGVAYKVRSAEASYVMEKIQNFSWVDKRNIFIMGHSEGGLASYFVTDERYSGIIFSGNPCKISHYMHNSKIPILAINWTNDTWVAHMGLCKDNWGQQKNATQILLEGKGHVTVHHQVAKDSVKEFIAKNTK
jgi:dienelactone hydrolase